MTLKTTHVYPSNEGWALKRRGGVPRVFKTQKEAIQAAQKLVTGHGPAQLVVLSKDGRIVSHEAHGMIKIQEPPRSGRLGSKKIANAVGKVVLKRLTADAPSAPAAK